MSSKRQKRGLYVVILLTLVLLIGGGCSQGQQTSTTTPQEATSTPEEVATTPQEATSTPEEVATTPQEAASTPEEVATTPQEAAATPEEVAAEIIPQEGDVTSYGLPLSLNNTQQLVDYYDAARLTPEQKSIMQNALLPLKAPCCDDNSMATCCCPCNLARSVWGLSSYLIVEKNYEADQVRESALEWLHFIHSNYYIIQELKSRGIDPATYDLSHENPCYVGKCELPFMQGGCGGMTDLRL